MEKLRFGSILVCVLIKVIEVNSTISPYPLAYVTEGQALDLSCYMGYGGNSFFLARQHSNRSWVVHEIGKFNCVVIPSLDPKAYRHFCNNTRFMLTIFNVTRERHAEIWTCSSNFFPNSSLETSIWVKVPVRHINFSSPSGGRIYVLEHVTTKLECLTSEERPRSTIKWLFKYSNYFLGTGFTVPNDDEELTSTHSILNYTFTRSKNGSYVYCTAVNIDGGEPVVSNTKEIIVQFPPVTPTLKVGTQPIFGNLTVIQGENITVSCESVSEPGPPTYYWTGQHVWQSILQIRRIQFPIKRSCTAMNTMKPTIGAPVNGSASVSVSIQVLIPPSEPLLKVGARIILGYLAVVRGDNVTVECESTGTPTPMIHWTGQVATASSKLKIDHIQSNVTSQCRATNTMNPTLRSPVKGMSSASLDIYIMSRPTVPRFTYFSNSGSNLTLSVSKLVVVNGTQFFIKCFGSNSLPGPPQYSWSGHVTSSTDTISFGGIDVQEEGNYTCHVENNMTRTVGAVEIGRNMNSLSIAIQYPPVVQVSSVNRSVVENEPVDFVCLATSKPSPTRFIWTGSKGSFSLNSSILAIYHTRREDAGVYKCTVRNQMQPTVEGSTVGQGSAEVTLTVLYHPDVIITQPYGTAIIEGDSSRIVCFAEGEPNNFTFSKWMHFAMDGSTKIREIRSSWINNNNKAYLQFKNTTYMDSGVYKCGVSNGINDYKSGDSIATKSVTQLVKGRPVIIQKDTNVSAGIHETISISATYYSNDGSIPTVKWYRKERDNRYEISNEANKFVENSAVEVLVPYYSVKVQQGGYRTTLNIKGASESDFADYELEILNSINKVVFSAKLFPQGPPSPPSMFSAVSGSITSSRVALSWKPGFHGGSDQTFYIQYKTSTTPWKSIVISGRKLHSTTFNVTVFNLTSETQYFFRIYATNRHGRSDFTPYQLTVTTNAVVLDEQKQTSNIGAIVGGATAGIVAAVVMILVVLFFLRRYKRLPFDIASLRQAFKWKKQREEVHELPQEQLHDHVYYNQTKFEGKSSRDKETNLEIRSVTNENANPNLFRLSSPYEKLATEKQRAGENAYEDLETKKSAEHSYANIRDAKRKQKPEIPQKPRLTNKPHANTQGIQQNDASAKPSKKGDQKARTTESPYMNLKLSNAQQL